MVCIPSTRMRTTNSANAVLLCLCIQLLLRKPNRPNDKKTIGLQWKGSLCACGTGGPISSTTENYLNHEQYARFSRVWTISVFGFAYAHAIRPNMIIIITIGRYRMYQTLFRSISFNLPNTKCFNFNEIFIKAIYMADLCTANLVATIDFDDGGARRQW